MGGGAPSVRAGKLFLNPLVFFCTAACNGPNDSFTIDLHPDVGEGAGPATGSTGAGLFFMLQAGVAASKPDAAPHPTPSAVRVGRSVHRIGLVRKRRCGRGSG